MKKLALLSLAALLFVACKNSDNTPEVLPSDQKYNGTISVVFQGETYPTDDVKVEAVFTSASTLTLKLYEVKFVPQMPVTLDITLPGVSCEKDGDSSTDYFLSGEGLVPYVGEKAYEQYTVTALSGFITPANLQVNLVFGSFPTKYEGAAVE